MAFSSGVAKGQLGGGRTAVLASYVDGNYYQRTQYTAIIVIIIVIIIVNKTIYIAPQRYKNDNIVKGLSLYQRATC